MSGPVNEETLQQTFKRHPIDGVVLRGSPPFTAQLMARAPHLRVIAKNGAGVDSVDLAAAARLGIQVKVAAGANANAVAEHALALMLSLIRNLSTMDRQVRAGYWPPIAYQGRDFRGSVVGILGFGSIGRQAAHLASCLGAQVCVYRRPHQTLECAYETLDDLHAFLARVDILSLHCPLNAQTRGLIGERELAAMKPGALLVNTARGPVVDEAALVAALQRGHLAGAGLDTFDVEPLDPQHALLQLPQVVLTPHVAGMTIDAALRVALMTADNILQGLNRA
jgi:D-3-phosphoglycerate dehydrogenase